ncbi:Rlip [Operophtera brumata]|uniref:Rlip n=1 Tax=Operophtera brumata TaxID=104452 RepID=A0A0L7LJ06_OPEBR|nr:Rlip [Operophtera brumata]
MLPLIGKLPSCNYSLVGWLVRHFESVVANEQVNHASIQTISSAMGPALNMSLNLLTYLVSKHAGFITPARDQQLWEVQRIVTHLKRHAGFITPARDQQLWEVQRIVTHLKRKLRSLQKSVEPNALSQQQPSIEEKDIESRRNSHNETNAHTDTEIKTPPDDKTQDKDSPKLPEPTFEAEFKLPDPTFEAEFEDNFEFKSDKDSFEFKPDKEAPEFETPPEPVIEKPKFTEKELKILRLELENAEYLQLKSLLQAKINSEQFEIVKLRSHVALKNKQEGLHSKENKEVLTPEDQELKQRLIKENAMLEQKRLTLINQIFQERVAFI